MDPLLKEFSSKRKFVIFPPKSYRFFQKIYHFLKMNWRWFFRKAPSGAQCIPKFENFWNKYLCQFFSIFQIIIEIKGNFLTFDHLWTIWKISLFQKFYFCHFHFVLFHWFSLNEDYHRFFFDSDIWKRLEKVV